MAEKALPTPEQLRQLVEYDLETGRMIWRERAPDTVDCPRESTRVRICRNWNARYAGKEAFTCVSKRGYYVSTIGCQRLTAHRVAWAIHNGEWPDGTIDHINGNPLDNRIANLRCVTTRENLRNQSLHQRNKSGAHGVWFDEGRGTYQAYIAADGGRVSLGRFADIEQAKFARRIAEKVLGYHPNHGRAKTIRSA